MTNDPVNDAGIFLVRTLFGLYILAVMLRFLLQAVRADFYNPLVQFLVTVTNPPLRPLRRYIPGVMGLDMAAVVLMLVLQVAELWLIFSMAGYSPTFGPVLVTSLVELFALLINVFIWAVIIQAILSWVNPNPYNPAVSVLRQLTEPLLAPARRMLPPISGVDLSPMLVIIVLYLVNILLVGPLRGLA